jgi:hypothetical protein
MYERDGAQRSAGHLDIEDEIVHDILSVYDYHISYALVSLEHLYRSVRSRDVGQVSLRDWGVFWLVQDFAILDAENRVLSVQDVYINHKRHHALIAILAVIAIIKDLD